MIPVKKVPGSSLVYLPVMTLSGISVLIVLSELLQYYYSGFDALSNAAPPYLHLLLKASRFGHLLNVRCKRTNPINSAI